MKVNDCPIPCPAWTHWIMASLVFSSTPLPLYVLLKHINKKIWAESLLNDTTCVVDMDYMVETLSSIKAKGVGLDLMGSIITHYATKCLPDLSPTQPQDDSNINITTPPDTPASESASLMKKRYLVERLMGIFLKRVDDTLL